MRPVIHVAWVTGSTKGFGRAMAELRAFRRCHKGGLDLVLDQIGHSD